MIGRVYKIIVNCSNECYVGSTIQECRARWQEHKYRYNNFKDGDRKITCYELFDKYGIENCKIILIKEYEVADKTHLEAYEQLWINKLRAINKQNPFCIKKLWAKQYKEKNGEIMKQKSREYHQKHKEERNKKHKEYVQKNKEKISQQKKEYHQKHREEILQKNKEKITCECGVEIVKMALSRHKRTKNHRITMTLQIKPVQ